ncbi:MAG: LuxR C-terminal-related transcriptional regulator [Steroidobacteraceae bacterium]|jgi:DNA-binding CsgD family transcriptional regulator|nr:LuxR C-terminal-related transcriptional regulator [Steroidobacteraceae bacterium]
MSSAQYSFAPGFGAIADRLTIRRVEDIRPAAEALHEFALSVANLRTAPCANIASKELMTDGEGAVLAAEVFGWVGPRPLWWKNTRIALTSPLVAACRYESEPFWCNQYGIYVREGNPYIEALDLANFCKRAMTDTAAIVVPIHLPFSQIGAVSFVSLDPQRIDLSAEFEQYADLFGLYARKFICGYVKVRNTQGLVRPDVRLSKREVECLRWAALGKTDEEIATIIHRSRATIRFHVHNAAVKLDAVNRSQALFKASQLGYLGAVG